MMNNIQQFQQMRQNRTIDNVARRSLYPVQAVASDDPLGPLPEGWGEWAALYAAEEHCSQFILLHCYVPMPYEARLWMSGSEVTQK